MPSPRQTDCTGYLKLREKEKYWEENIHRKSCHGQADWEIEDAFYCVIHAPTEAKATIFDEVLKERLKAKNYNFSGAWFPGEVDFKRHIFDSPVFFNSAVFNGHARFDSSQFTKGKVYFTSTEFHGTADFRSTEFLGGYVEFHSAKFNFNADFFSAIFSAGEVSFILAEFNGHSSFIGAEFRGFDVYFYKAKFMGNAPFSLTRFTDVDVDFNSTDFSFGADFSGATFGKSVNFGEAIFGKHMNFSKTVFEKQASFDNTIFKSGTLTDFALARFKDFTRFMDSKLENDVEFYFGEATFENPERIHFHSLKLQPRWFINVDSRKFNFENVVFPVLKVFYAASIELSKAGSLLNVVKKSNKTQGNEPVSKPFELLTISCRRLAENAEENKRFEEAADFRYMAMELSRRSGELPPALQKLYDALRHIYTTGDVLLVRAKNHILHTLKMESITSVSPLLWLYWFSSGYGERSWRAFVVLLYIWGVFALFYMSPWFCSFNPPETKTETTRQTETRIAEETKEQPKSLYFGEALAYSFAVMALQKPEPKPLGPFTYALVLMETVLGPLQAALLALAIRRKFMR